MIEANEVPNDDDDCPNSRARKGGKERGEYAQIWGEEEGNG